MTLPRATQPFVEFASVLRANGFAVAPDQTIGFIEAVGLLGPRSLTDIYRAARGLFAIPKDREAEFDALFRAFFLGQTVSAPIEGEDDEVEAHEATGDADQADLAEDEEPGQKATAMERLGHRHLTPADEDAVLRAFARDVPARLPRRRSYRFERARTGPRPDLRRTLRDAARRDGEILTLARSRRRTRQRRIVLLIDVSGSMADRTAPTLRLAHALTRAADRAEVFTLGTRLTRVTPALRLRDPGRALARAADLVADIDGGTRIGDALAAFLAVPRYAGMARGAVVIVLSDGLERGDPTALIAAVDRLSRLAWRLDWLSPLATGPGFRPQTQALAAIRPDLDTLGDGSSTERLASHILNRARVA